MLKRKLIIFHFSSHGRLSQASYSTNGARGHYYNFGEAKEKDGEGAEELSVGVRQAGDVGEGAGGVGDLGQSQGGEEERETGEEVSSQIQHEGQQCSGPAFYGGL